MKSTILGFCLVAVLLVVLDIALAIPSNASLLTALTGTVSPKVSESSQADKGTSKSAIQPGTNSTVMANSLPSLLPITGADHPDKTISANSQPEQLNDAYVWYSSAATALIPIHITIKSIHLDAPVVTAQVAQMNVGGNLYWQSLAPSFYAAGWLPNSSTPGTRGNTVLIGHHNTNGEVFKALTDLKAGDRIVVTSKSSKSFTYIVSEKHILAERDQSLSEQVATAKWILPTADERLTLVTCWPYTSNTHRLIVVAYPAAD